MPREIRTTIAVDGEAAFKRAINEANTSIRNMGTQLTLATAEFKKDGDAMKLVETRAKALRGEIGQQEEIVKALERAVKESAAAFGENSEKTEKWEAELNRARARLVNLQSELTLNNAGLDRNGKSFDESSEKAADYQATLQTIGKGVSFENVTTGISRITGGFESAVRKVFNFAKAMRDTLADAGSWADDLMTDATKYNMDVEELQRWRNAADFIDTDVDTIITARDRLSKKMAEGWTKGSGKEQKNMWELLGIDLKDGETGKMRDQMSVMFELGETLRSMVAIDGNDVRASELAMEVFGKSYRELLPLFAAGQAQWEKTVAEQRVVSREHVESLGAMDDANQQLENSWETLKMSALAEIAPVLTDATNGLSELLNQFNDWIETDEGKEAMKGLSEALKELFGGIKDVKFQDVINTAKNGVNGLKDGLQWLAAHKDEVKTALIVIGGGFAGLKVAEVATNVWSIVNGMKQLWNKGQQPGTGTDTPAPITHDAQPVTPVSGGWYTGLRNKLTETATKSNNIWVQTGGLFPALGDRLINETNAGRAIRDGGDILEGISQDIAEKRAEVEKNASTFWDDWGNLFKTAGDNAARFWNKVWYGNEYGPQRTVPQEEIPQNPGRDLWEVPAPEATPADVLAGIGREMSEAQRAAAEEWWDVHRADPMGDATDEKWAALEELMGADNELYLRLSDAIENWLESPENQDNSLLEQEDLLQGAVSEMKQNTDAGKVVAEKVNGMDIRKYNGLPAEMVDAVRRGAADGVGRISVQLDGYPVGKAVWKYVNAEMGASMP